jgi:molybdenum cofactor guanylyltransferase
MILPFAVAAVVLAGGRSARMGRPKAELVRHGETLLARTVRIAGEVAGEVVVVLAPGADPVPGVRWIADARSGRGPLEGIAAGLAAVSAGVVVILPCDLPNLDGTSLQELLVGLGEADSCVPVLDGEPRPLPGVYRRAVSERVAELLRQDRLAVRGLLSDRANRIVPANPHALRGANTPAEWAELTGEVFAVADEPALRHADGSPPR